MTQRGSFEHDDRLEEEIRKIHLDKDLKEKNISKRQLLQLRIPESIEEYKGIPGEPIQLKYDDMIIYVKRTFLNPGSIITLSEIVPEIVLPRYLSFRYTVIQDVKKFKLPLNFQLLNGLLNTYLTSTSPLNIHPRRLAIWISLFASYNTEWAKVYLEYVLDPDECVEIESGMSGEDYLADEVFDTKEIGSDLFSSSNIKATCHLLLISLLKGFSKDAGVRENQLTQYLTQRKKAAFASMGAIEGNLVIKDKFFLDYSDTVKALPKLLEKFYQFITRNKAFHREVGSASILVATSAMTTIMAVIEFCEAEKLTYAHTNPKVLSDMVTFTKACEKLQEELGDQFPYYRLLRPKDSSLQAASYPHLATAAVAYKQEFGEKSFSQVVLPARTGVSRTLIADAKKLDKRDILLPSEQLQERYTPEMKAILHKIGIDIKKLTSYHAETLNVTAIQAEEFQKALQTILKAKQ